MSILDELPAPNKDDLFRIAFTSDHRNLFETFVADVMDVVPIIGEVTGGLRALDASNKGKAKCSAAYTGDIILADLVPANLLCYMLEKTNITLPELPGL